MNGPLILAGLAGYGLMNRNKTGYLGQLSAMGSTPTSNAVPSSWTEMDFINSTQAGNPNKNATFYAHEIHSWYTNNVWTNNPPTGSNPIWLSLVTKLQSNANQSKFQTLSQAEMSAVQAAAAAPSGHFYVWRRNFGIRLAAQLEQKMMQSVQPIATNLITTTQFLNQVLVPLEAELSKYLPQYQVALDALVASVQPQTPTYAPFSPK